MAGNVKPDTTGASAGGIGLPIVAGIASNVASGFINSFLSKRATEYQTQQQKELMKYQWDNFLSPSAQVSAYGNAGLNPAAMFTNGNAIQGPSGASVTSPSFGIGTTSMSDLAAIISATAAAKKAGVEVPHIEAETQGKVLENSRKEYENYLLKEFGLKKSAAELALAEEHVKLAMQQGDVNKRDIALKEWQAAKEKAASEVNERQRDILQKELDNKDIELKLRNDKMSEEIKTEKSAQSANFASAENSRASASNYRQQARINSVLADIQESTSVQQVRTQIQKLIADQYISQADSDEAKRRIQALEHMRDDGFREKLDDLLIWLKTRLNILK